MKRLALAAAAALAALPARADFNSASNGVTAVDFLNLAVGARAAAMGQAYSAAADAADALYWNPAGLACIPGRSAVFMHAAYIASSYFDYAAYAQNMGSGGAFGLGLQYFSPGAFARTDDSGADIGSVSLYDLAASVGYAFRFHDAGAAWDGFSFGVAGKFIESKIVSSAQTWAVDLGALSPDLVDGRLRLALTAQNIGADMKFDQANEPLPLTFKTGSAFKITGRWLAALDVVIPKGGQPYAGIGTEYRLWDQKPWAFAVRGGFDSQTLPGITGFSGAAMGFGVSYSGGGLDYAFVPLGGLGQASRISLSYKF